jgi:hypothetical protein
VIVPRADVAMRKTLLVLSIVCAAAGIEGSAPAQDTSTHPLLIHAYKGDLAGVRAANPDVHLSVGRDHSQPDEPVLFVKYPAPTREPGGRDVRCDAETHDWTGGRAISFHIKPSHDMRLSISFFDRNRVVYTTWADVKGNVWQPVRVAFDEIRPNPYFQPPDAKLGFAVDVSDVKFIAFAPQDTTSGRLAISKFIVAK